MVRIKDIHETFLAFYVVVKFGLGVPNGRNNIYVQFFLVILTFLFIVLFALFLAISSLFFIALKWYLKYKEGKRFVRMLTGQDGLWTALNIHALFTVPAVDTYEETLRRFRPFLERLLGSCKKLHCLVRSCLGYHYLVESNLELDNFVNEINGEDGQFWTKTTWLNFVESNIMKPGSLENKTWDFSIFKQPIQWEDGSLKYGLVLSLNHSVCDGIGIVSLLKNKVCDQFEFLDLTLNIDSSASSTKSLDDAYLFTQSMTRYVRPTTYQHLLSLFIEDEPKYVPLIKEMKTKLGVGFSDILLAGFSMAFREYMAKKNIAIRSVNVNSALRPFNADSMPMIYGNYDYNNIYNSVIITTMRLDAETCDNMIKTVRSVHRKSRKFAGSSNILIEKLIGNIVHILPPPCSQFLMGKLLNGMNMTMTNFTGLKSLKSGGYELENVTFCISPIHFTDFVLCILTQDDKFHLSVISRTDVVDNKDDLNAIINRAFQHIDSLDHD